MLIQQVVVTGQNQVELLEATLDEDSLAPTEVLIETEATFISAGTELANYTGVTPEVFVPGSWCAYPWKSGYANVGVVRAAGPEVKRVAVGQRVFTFGPHASAYIYEAEDTHGHSIIVAVPDSLSSPLAAASRMAGVAATAFLLANRRHNPWIAIFGLGLVGNLAAQMFAIEGARVIGIDPSPARRNLANRCGIEYTFGGSDDEVRSYIQELTNGVGAAVAVDAVGHSGVIKQCVLSTAAHGEVILLGTPRAPVTDDLTEIFASIHYRWITLKGALEWCLPIYPRTAGEMSLYTKQQMIFDWMQRGKLHIEPLISHVMPPVQIKEAYEGLLHRKDEYFGVALDWS